jgi:hypothetical protein
MERAKLSRTWIPRVLLQAFFPHLLPARFSGGHEIREIGPWQGNRPRQQTPMSHGGSTLGCPQIRLEHTRLFRTEDSPLRNRPTVHNESTAARGAFRRKARSRLWLSKRCRPRAHEGELPGRCASGQLMDTRSEPERRATCTVPEACWPEMRPVSGLSSTPNLPRPQSSSWRGRANQPRISPPCVPHY